MYSRSAGVVLFGVLLSWWERLRPDWLVVFIMGAEAWECELERRRVWCVGVRVECE